MADRIQKTSTFTECDGPMRFKGDGMLYDKHHGNCPGVRDLDFPGSKTAYTCPCPCHDWAKKEELSKLKDEDGWVEVTAWNYKVRRFEKIVVLK